MFPDNSVERPDSLEIADRADRHTGVLCHAVRVVGTPDGMAELRSGLVSALSLRLVSLLSFSTGLRVSVQFLTVANISQGSCGKAEP